jgi:DNA repair exonuclease SbcCD ATPase subunit
LEALLERLDALPYTEASIGEAAAAIRGLAKELDLWQLYSKDLDEANATISQQAQRLEQMDCTIDILKQTRAERDRLAAELAALTVERDALRAELEAAKKDAERYRWLKKHAYLGTDVLEAMRFGNLDAAIDAALKERE